MVDHFHAQVLAAGKIGGQARAMVITSGIERAIQYFHAFQAYLRERKSPYQAIVAFSGEHEYGGAKVSEASLNGFASGDIARKIQSDPYRFLICADKFQTGYDEPLLHTMYVDKLLAGIKAVQTLSRLNRGHPQKYDCFVLDFQNNSEAITVAFQDYFRTTLLAEETDPNKLHDLKAVLDATQVYSPEQMQRVVELFLGGEDRDKLDPILDACVAVYTGTLDEEGQVDFKSKAKMFCRTYSFLSSVIAYSNAEWEKLSILLNLLIPKLPAPQEEDGAGFEDGKGPRTIGSTPAMHYHKAVNSSTTNQWGSNMNVRSCRITIAGMSIAALLSISAAHAQLGDLLKKEESSASSGGLGNLGGLGGALSGPSITSGSASNVAGLLEFCIKNNYLGGNKAASVKDSLMSKLQGGSSASSDSGYSSGAKGILSSSDGSQLDLGGMKKQLTKKICDKVLDQGKSML